MVDVELTPHLFTFFPDLAGRPIQVEATNVAQVVQQLDRLAPGIALYICDEHGSLRTHVNIFIGEERVIDRVQLRDRVEPGARVFVLQALSGG